MKEYTDQEFKQAVDECVAEVEEMLQERPVVVNTQAQSWWQRLTAVLF